jgi:N-acetylmuramic acid 6-phosphate (MurNAc-6-P) etherase
MFPGGNLLSTATIGQGVLEVKLHHQQVQITVCPSMMCGDASLRAVPPEKMVVNEMTSATLLKIGGVSGIELCPHHDGL